MNASTYNTTAIKNLKAPTSSAWDEVVYEEFSKFQQLHNQSTLIIDKIETALLIAGLIGNTLGFFTLLLGRHMRTPSFVYHKALVFAYLVYCLNFSIVKCVNSTLTVRSERRQLSYYDMSTAYYAVIVNRVITSACGYLALYTSLAISIDRFLALVMYKMYSKFNRHGVAYIWIGVSLVLSIGLHSWAPWMENEIRGENLVEKSMQNLTVTVYRYQEAANHQRLKPYLKAKDWYNLIIRFAYAVLLTIFTSVVIYMFFQQQKRKISLCNVPKKRIRRERSLFYLMIAVVILAYIQVVPREGKRVLELIYPQEFLAKKIADQSLSIGTRRTYLLFGLYGFTFTTPILNLCTAIERSLIFYFYFSLNHSFRHEVLTLIHLRKAWRNVMVKMGSSRAGEERSSWRETSIRESTASERAKQNRNSVIRHSIRTQNSIKAKNSVDKKRSDADSEGTALLAGCELVGKVTSVQMGSDEKIIAKGSHDTHSADCL